MPTKHADSPTKVLDACPQPSSAKNTGGNMTKTLIVYFSQAGSTRKVAQAVAAGLRGASPVPLRPRIHQRVGRAERREPRVPRSRRRLHRVRHMRRGVPDRQHPGGRPRATGVGRDCIACAYCDLRCPVEAIHSPLRWRSFAPLLHAIERRLLKWPGVARPERAPEGDRTTRDRRGLDPAHRRDGACDRFLLRPIGEGRARPLLPLVDARAHRCRAAHSRPRRLRSRPAYPSPLRAARRAGRDLDRPDDASRRR